MHFHPLSLVTLCFTCILQGCRVIGCAGTDDKVKWLKEDLKLDFAFNYKTDDLDKTLYEVAPDGIDVYYDNVGITVI